MTQFSSGVRDYLLSQYRESELLISLIENLLTEADELYAVNEQLLAERYLDKAIGVQLDILGVILGQPRDVVDVSAEKIFGFDPDIGSYGFGDLDDVTVGGRFRSDDESGVSIRALLDEEYRSLLYAQTFKNTTNCSPDAVITMIEAFVGFGTEVQIVDGDMEYEVLIGAVLTDTQRSLLDAGYIAKTAGVRVTYTEYTP